MDGKCWKKKILSRNNFTAIKQTDSWYSKIDFCYAIHEIIMISELVIRDEWNVIRNVPILERNLSKKKHTSYHGERY